MTKVVIKAMLASALALLLFMPAVMFASEGGGEKQWRFRVFLDDSEIGYHTVRLRDDVGTKRVSVEAEFDVKFLFITAYRYQHKTEEFWSGSCLSEIDSMTNDNGKQLFIRALPDNDDNGFPLETHNGPRNLQGCVRSFAYWDLDLLNSAQLLNTQTGEYEQVKLIDLGGDVLNVNGKERELRRYRLDVGKYNIDLWYTLEKEWVALKSTTEGGYQLSYLPALE